MYYTKQTSVIVIKHLHIKYSTSITQKKQNRSIISNFGINYVIKIYYAFQTKINSINPLGSQTATFVEHMFPCSSKIQF